MNTVKDYVNLRLTHADKVSEAQGCPLELYDCKKYKPMKDLKIYGESVQEGTPTPDTPVEIVSVGEKSVNLLPDAREIYNGNGAEDSEVVGNYLETIDDGRECVRFTSNRSCKYTKIKFKENIQYTISFDCKAVKKSGYSSFPNYEIALVVYYTDGQYSAMTITNDDVWRKVKFTTKAGLSVSHLGMYSYDYRDYIYIDINTFQIEEGTVATEYRPYGKYKIPIVIKGKNLVEDAREVFKDFSSFEELDEDGRKCIRMQSNGGAKAIFDFGFKENTQYTISFDYKCKYKNTGYNLDYDVPFAVYYTDGTNDNITFVSIDNIWRKKVFTTHAGKTVSHIQSISFHWVVWNYIDINTFQIEEGVTATEYEPYVEMATTNIFLDEPLRKIGDYADFVDFKRNKVIRKNYKQIIGEGFSIHYNGVWYKSGHTTFVYPNYLKVYGIQWSEAYMNRFKRSENWTWIGDKFPGNYFQHAQNGRNLHVIIENQYLNGVTDDSTQDEKKSAVLSFLAENETYIVFPMQTPVQEPLNIDLPKLKSKTTIIEVNTSLEPSNVFGKYIKR